MLTYHSVTNNTLWHSKVGVQASHSSTRDGIAWPIGPKSQMVTTCAVLSFRSAMLLTVKPLTLTLVLMSVARLLRVTCPVNQIMASSPS